MFKIQIRTANAAYDPEEGDIANEIVRQLDEIGEALLCGNDFGEVRDVNGNTVGRWWLDADDDDTDDAADARRWREFVAESVAE